MSDRLGLNFEDRWETVCTHWRRKSLKGQKERSFHVMIMVGNEWRLPSSFVTLWQIFDELNGFVYDAGETEDDSLIKLPLVCQDDYFAVPSCFFRCHRPPWKPCMTLRHSSDHFTTTYKIHSEIFMGGMNGRRKGELCAVGLTTFITTGVFCPIEKRGDYWLAWSHLVALL